MIEAARGAVQATGRVWAVQLGACCPRKVAPQCRRSDRAAGELMSGLHQWQNPSRSIRSAAAAAGPSTVVGARRSRRRMNGATHWDVQLLLDEAAQLCVCHGQLVCQLLLHDVLLQEGLQLARQLALNECSGSSDGLQ